MQKLDRIKEVTINATIPANSAIINLLLIETLETTVSIVIPTYERLEDLSELLVSIMEQTFKPLEVIVVDDTPSDIIRDKCMEIENWFSQNNINLLYLRNYDAQSLTVARNLGVSQANCDLITFLDSDVVLEPDYIEKIVKVFKDDPNALGVQGFIENNPKPQSFSQFLNRIFRLSRLTTNNCNFLEYPSELIAIANCQNLVGSNMTYRKKVFGEFMFDKSMEKYSYMEDALFSHSIYRKHPNQLFITPHARCIHKISKAGRLEKKEIEHLKNKQRKYVLEKLFGKRGILLFYWQTLGLKIKLIGNGCWQTLGRQTMFFSSIANITKNHSTNLGMDDLVSYDYSYMEDEIRPG